MRTHMFSNIQTAPGICIANTLRITLNDLKSVLDLLIPTVLRCKTLEWQDELLAKVLKELRRRLFHIARDVAAIAKD